MRQLLLTLAACLAAFAVTYSEDPDPAAEKCIQCSGTKRHRCDICDSKSQFNLPCVRCDKGTMACVKCAGKGTVRCSCAANRNSDCKLCHARGFVDCDVKECKKGKVGCTWCFGKGKVMQLCPACAGTGRQECLRCIDWGASIRVGGVTVNLAGKDALEKFKVEPHELKSLEGAIARAIPGKTLYGMERVLTPQPVGWKNGVALVLPVLLSRPSARSLEPLNPTDAAALGQWNAAILGKAIEELKLMAAPVWEYKWAREADYIAFAIVQHVDENGVSRYRPMAMSVVPTERLRTADLKDPNFDIFGISDFKHIHPAVK